MYKCRGDERLKSIQVVDIYTDQRLFTDELKLAKAEGGY